MKLIKPDIRHFFISNFYKFKNYCSENDVIKYTFNKVAPGMKGVFWQLQDTMEDVYNVSNNTGAIFFFNTVNPHISQTELFNLWKEQINYVYGKEMQFELV